MGLQPFIFCSSSSPSKLAISSFREVLRACPMALDAAQQLLNLGVKPLEIQEITLEAISGLF